MSFTTPTAPGDPAPIGLYVGGGVVWPANQSVLKVLNGYTTKIAGAATFDAFNKNPNDYQIVEPGAGIDSSPRIEGTVGQSPDSIGEPVGDLIDIPGAFSQYRDLTSEMAACAQTVVPRNANGDPLDDPIPAGSNVYLTLTAGQTNVLNLTTEELATLGQFTFTGQPPAPGTPLLVNITGGSYTGTWPNQAGISGTNAPYILWNFPDATTVTVTGGDSVEGTLYAPNADLTWQATNNLEGNVIAESLVHGPGALGGGLRGFDDFQFNDTLECEPSPSPSPSSPTASPSSPTPTPTPTSPSPTPTGETPTPGPRGGAHTERLDSHSWHTDTQRVHARPDNCDHLRWRTARRRPGQSAQHRWTVVVDRTCRPGTDRRRDHGVRLEPTPQRVAQLRLRWLCRWPLPYAHIAAGQRRRNLSA